MDFDLPDPPGSADSADSPDLSDSLGDDLGTGLNDASWVSCPYCGEASELVVDLAGGTIQEYVEDCEVCCQPCLVRAQLDAEGHASVTVSTLDDE